MRAGRRPLVAYLALTAGLWIIIAFPTFLAAARATSFIDDIRFTRIEYRSARYEDGRALTQADVGPHFDTVQCDISETQRGVPCPFEQDRSGYLPAGTPIYTVSGYRPDFRLAAVLRDRIVLYQVWANPRAKTGQDLFDISGKVSTVQIRREDSRTREAVRAFFHPQNRIEITAPSEVDALVELVLKSPVGQPGHPDYKDTVFRYWITFHLWDGTALGGAYFPSAGRFRGGLVLPPEFRQAIEQRFATQDQQ